MPINDIHVSTTLHPMTQDKEDKTINVISCKWGITRIQKLFALQSDTVSSKREYSMNANNINKQHKLVVREEKILKKEQDKPGTLLEFTKMRTMHAPASRRFDGLSPCCKLLNEA
jgi:hypothetical protein